jgi:hypothetical protein
MPYHWASASQRSVSFSRAPKLIKIVDFLSNAYVRPHSIFFSDDALTPKLWAITCQDDEAMAQEKTRVIKLA